MPKKSKWALKVRIYIYIGSYSSPLWWWGKKVDPAQRSYKWFELLVSLFMFTRSRMCWPLYNGPKAQNFGIKSKRMGDLGEQKKRTKMITILFRRNKIDSRMKNSAVKKIALSTFCYRKKAFERKMLLGIPSVCSKKLLFKRKRSFNIKLVTIS